MVALIDFALKYISYFLLEGFTWLHGMCQPF